MKRLMTFAVALGTVAFLMGCSEKKSETTQTASASDETQMPPVQEKMKRPANIPQATATGGISPFMRDSLQRMAKRHGITRDRYWDNRGGILANAYFEVWYPIGRTTVTHGMHFFNVLMPARDTFRDFFGEVPSEPVVVISQDYMDRFKKETSRDWWHYSYMRGDTITFQPVYVLVKRGIDAIALPHEYFKWGMRKISRDGSPRWFEEGLASVMSNEGDLLIDQMREFKKHGFPDVTAEQLEVILDAEEERSQTRIAYYRAYRMVQNMIDTYGQDKVRNVVFELGKSKTFDEACRAALQVDQQTVLRVAMKYTIDV